MLVSALCLLGLSHLAHGHGYLASPQSRNLIANSDYCPHCLNAGGGHKGLPVKFELSQVAIFVSDGFRVACSIFAPLPRTGVAAVRIPGQAWPAGHHGICGDNWALAQPRPHEAGGRHYTGTIGG